MEKSVRIGCLGKQVNVVLLIMRNRPFLKWMLVFLLSMMIVLAVRHWGMESCVISSNTMEMTLQKGDRVLVNKILSENNPARNRVVLFSNPQEGKTKDSFIVSRCIGLPGDTVTVSEQGYEINGALIPFAPHSFHDWFVNCDNKNECLSALQKMKIHLREWMPVDSGYTLRLTFFEAFLIGEEMSFGKKALQRVENAPIYTLIVPRKGEKYALNEMNIPLCREAIIRETDGKARFEQEKVYVDDKEISSFIFQQDYYWILSDNSFDVIDSRHLGFIPTENIKGTVWFCWYSPDKKRCFTTIQ